jgi:hypothetical protein
MTPIRIVLLVAAVLGVAFIVGFFYVVNDDESAMEAGGALFFGRLSDGKTDEAYDTAAAPLKASLERPELHILAEDLKRFGRFRKIVEVTRLEKTKVGGSLDATALYERGQVKTKLTFLRDGRKWSVAGVELDFARDAFPPPDALALVASARTFGQAFAADDRLELYNSLDPVTRAKLPPSKFDNDMARVHLGCGKMTIGEPAVRTPVLAGEVLVEASVMCERSGQLSLKTTWVWQRTRWRLAALSWS